MKRSVVVTALAGLSLALLAGCKTSQSEQPSASKSPAVTPLVVTTNKPITLPAKPSTPADSSDNMEPNILAWDSTAKEYHAHPGEKYAAFSFSFTNVSARPVVIYDTGTTCDCTVATNLPSKPWTIPSGGTGTIGASVDLSKKIGIATNGIIIFTSQGNRRLNVTTILPDIN